MLAILFVAVFTFAKATVDAVLVRVDVVIDVSTTVLLSISTSFDATNTIPAAVSITTLVVAPASGVLSVPEKCKKATQEQCS
tara:strand:- start:133 stop:378 length:246 start_codon:yes stop_codon:yes gene_type:complete